MEMSIYKKVNSIKIKPLFEPFIARFVKCGGGSMCLRKNGRRDVFGFAINPNADVTNQ